MYTDVPPPLKADGAKGCVCCALLAIAHTKRQRSKSLIGNRSRYDRDGMVVM